MCGIIAYIGHRDARPILIEGLKRLEYRGYDSAGLAVINGDGADAELKVVRAVGRVRVLEEAIDAQGELSGSLGMPTGEGPRGKCLNFSGILSSLLLKMQTGTFRLMTSCPVWFRKLIPVKELG